MAAPRPELGRIARPDLVDQPHLDRSVEELRRDTFVVLRVQGRPAPEPAAGHETVLAFWTRSPLAADMLSLGPQAAHAGGRRQVHPLRAWDGAVLSRRGRRGPRRDSAPRPSYLRSEFQGSEILLGLSPSLNTELTATSTVDVAHEGVPVLVFRSQAGKSDDVMSTPTR